MTEASAGSDISALLPRLEVPALVLHPIGQPWITQESSAQVAALIPNGRLAVLSPFGVWGDPDEAIAAIVDFFGGFSAAVARALGTPLELTPLSSREEEVLRLLAAGRTNAAIAEALVITQHRRKARVEHPHQDGVGQPRPGTAYARDKGLA